MASIQFCIHEAAHAIIAIRLGLSFRRVFVGLGHCGDGKYLQGAICGLIGKHELSEEIRITTVAGCVAQSRFEWEAFKPVKDKFKSVVELIKDRFNRHGEDNVIYIKYLHPLTMEEVFDSDINKASRFVDENWSDIILVANELGKVQTMTREMILSFLSDRA